MILRITWKKVFLLTVVFFAAKENSVAQQPGGVSGTRFWLVTTEGKNKFLREISGHGRIKDIAVKDENLRNINFHSTSNKIPAYASTAFKNIDFSQGTVVGAFYPDDENSSSSFLFKAEDKNTTAGMQENKITGKNDQFKYAFGSLQNNTTFEVVPNTQHVALKSGIYYAATAKLNHSVWGTDKQLGLQNSFTGYLPELIVYNRVLSPLERWKVETYLAIKYGFTLDTSYISAGGKILWDLGNSNTRSFHHRVCGIAKDIAAALMQPRSNTSYEEKYSSYKFNSYGITKNDGITEGYKFVPAADTPSLYRSLTIGFSDQALNSVKDRSYILWGDNDAAILPADKYLAISNFKNVEMINRVWMINNPGMLTDLLRIVIAGQSYLKKSTVFEHIYQPYNYQFYRYLLIQLKNGNLKEPDTTALLLNSYFGREQPKTFSSKQAFNTRTIIWDSVALNKNNAATYYTFGRVPLLTFWSVGKVPAGIKKYDSVAIYYPYITDEGISTETHLDTVVRSFKQGDSLKFRISVGVPPVQVRFKEAGTTPWIPWNGNIPEEIEVLAEAADNPVDTSEIKVENVVKGNGKKNFIARQPWRKKLPTEYYSIGSLQPGKTYIIELTDKIGQRSTLTVKLNPSQTQNTLQ